jgi:hypothetical protein
MLVFEIAAGIILAVILLALAPVVALVILALGVVGAIGYLSSHWNWPEFWGLIVAVASAVVISLPVIRWHRRVEADRAKRGLPL